jgi:hypothetical protein
MALTDGLNMDTYKIDTGLVRREIKPEELLGYMSCAILTCKRCDGLLSRRERTQSTE